MPEMHEIFEVYSNTDINIFSILVVCIISLTTQFLVLVLSDVRMSLPFSDVDSENSDLISMRTSSPELPSGPALISWVIRPPISTLLFSLLFIWGAGLHGLHDRSMILGFSWGKGNNFSLLMVCFVYWSSYLLLTSGSAYEELRNISHKNLFIFGYNSICWI